MVTRRKIMYLAYRFGWWHPRGSASVRLRLARPAFGTMRTVR